MSGPAESGGIVGAEGWEKEGEVKLVRITRAEGGEWRRDGGRRWRREV